MWVELSNGSVANLENGLELSVRSVDDERAVRSYNVVCSRPNARTLVTLGEGYKSEEEAANALTEFLSAQDIKTVRFSPPVEDVETEEGKEKKSSKSASTKDESKADSK